MIFSKIKFRNTCRNVSILRKYADISYIHNPGSEKFQPLTIGQLLEKTCKIYGDRLSIISREQNQTLTFQETLDQADQLAAGLRSLGLQRGDRIGMWSQNRTEWYVTYMATARAGLVMVNINPALEAMELEYCINKVGLKAIISDYKHKKKNHYETLQTVAPELRYCQPGDLKSRTVPTLKTVILTTDETLSGTFSYGELVDMATSESVNKVRSIQNLIQIDDPCHIQFTSGTTGHPKAAIHSHFQVVNNSYFAGKRIGLSEKYHKICIQVPFFHVFGTVASIGCGLNFGSTLVIPAASYNPDKSLDAIRDEKCTVIYGTPTMYVDLIHIQKERKEDIDPDFGVTGGASCASRLALDAKKYLKLKKMKSIYGLTETTAVSFGSLPDDDDTHMSTVGYPMDHMEYKVVDLEGNIVPRGTPGELCTRGYSNIRGYWGDEEKTKELIDPSGWIRTGDQFILDENGYGRVVGRLKEMLVRGGENIFPKEIEDFLITHPDIVEVHIIGLPHERLGEEVCACVKIRIGSILTLEDVRDFCKNKIASFKIPSAMRLVESFPTTTSGKIQKFKLVQAA